MILTRRISLSPYPHPEEKGNEEEGRVFLKPTQSYLEQLYYFYQPAPTVT